MNELLEETINRVRQGSLDIRAANAIGLLASTLLRVLDREGKEERLAHLEKPPTEQESIKPFVYGPIFDRIRQEQQQMTEAPQYDPPDRVVSLVSDVDPIPDSLTHVSIPALSESLEDPAEDEAPVLIVVD